jgi:uncharacterized membrane protein
MKKVLLAAFLVLALTPITAVIAQSTQKTNYEWIKSARIFIIDGYSYPLSPRIEFNATKLAETMADMHANVVRMSTSGSQGFLIPAKQFKMHPDLKNRDLLAETIAACKPRGIKVVPYVAAGNSINTSIVNREFAQKITPGGEIFSSYDAGVGIKATPTCWNTPYRKAFYDVIENIMSQYDVDGIYFDAWLPFYFFGGREQVCYCDGCKKGFRNATGKELPYRKNTAYTPEELKTIRLYRKWYREELFKVFTETKRIVKSHKDIPLIYNINNPDRITNEDFRILQGSDAFLYERGRSMMERAEGVSLATAHGLAVWPYIGTYDPFPRVPHFQFELEQEIFTSVAFGGSPILYHTYFFTDHPKAREPIKEAFQVLSQNDEYISGFSSQKFCAVVWNNSDPPGHAVEAWLWNSNARLSSLGSFSACINSHIQTTSLLKQDLDNIDLLSKYKVLYLPDICYLTDKQTANIKSFVENGGGLVMTYATSLYDEHGNKRSDFTLGDIAKIRYQVPDENYSKKVSESFAFGSVQDMYLKTRSEQEVIKPMFADGLIPTHLYETVDVLDSANVTADIVLGTASEPVVPGVVVARYGKGKVAYIAAEVGSMYMQTGIRELADLIRDVVEYVSAEKVSYEIDAPFASLISNMTVNGNMMVLHLVNRTASNQERMWQNIYYIPPIENVKIKVRIPVGKEVKKITPFVPVEFSQKREKDLLEITLPRIDKYQAIAIELQ